MCDIDSWTVYYMELKFFENRTEDQLVSEVHVTHAAVVVEMDGKVLYVKKRGKSTLELPSVDVSGISGYGGQTSAYGTAEYRGALPAFRVGVFRDRRGGNPVRCALLRGYKLNAHTQ